MLLFLSFWIPSTGTVSWLDGLNILFLLIWQVTFFVHSVKWIDVLSPLRVKNWSGIVSNNSLDHDRGGSPWKEHEMDTRPMQVAGAKKRHFRGHHAGDGQLTLWGVSDILCEIQLQGFPGGSDAKESACQCSRRGFNPWVGKIRSRRKQQPTPAFLPEKSPGQRSLQDTVHRVTESDTIEQLSMHRGIQLWVVLPWVAVLLAPP